MCLTKKKVYGRKALVDDFGREYFVDNEPVGEEDSVELSILYRDGLNIRTVEAALRPSPPAATLGHLQRLAMHKRLGSSDTDRAVLLHDYAEALRPYSDFVVFIACKSLWENDESPFYPKIKPVSELCELIHANFTALLRNFRDDAPRIASPKTVNKYDRSQYLDDPRENPMRRKVCEFLVSKGKEDYFEQTRLYSNYYLEGMARGLGMAVDIDY